MKDNLGIYSNFTRSSLSSNLLLRWLAGKQESKMCWKLANLKYCWDLAESTLKNVSLLCQPFVFAKILWDFIFLNIVWSGLPQPLNDATNWIILGSLRTFIFLWKITFADFQWAESVTAVLSPVVASFYGSFNTPISIHLCL